MATTEGTEGTEKTGENSEPGCGWMSGGTIHGIKDHPIARIIVDPLGFAIDLRIFHHVHMNDPPLNFSMMASAWYDNLQTITSRGRDRFRYCHRSSIMIIVSDPDIDFDAERITVIAHFTSRFSMMVL